MSIKREVLSTGHYSQPGPYSISYCVYVILMTGILPNGFILLLTLLTTYRNVPLAKKNESHQQRSQRTETQLIVVKIV